MSDQVDPVRDLLEALALSPDNIPLRRHVGDLCLKRGLLDDAERVFRQGVELAPNSDQMKLGLAQCFQRQGKHSAAIVLVEELLKRPDPPALAFLLQARLLLRGGNLSAAGRAYRRAVEADPALADESLAEALGEHAHESPAASSTAGNDPNAAPPWEEDEDADDTADVDAYGRVRMRADADDAPAGVEMEKPDINFADVGGMDDVKEQVRLKIIEPMRHADIYKAYGKAVGGGILLYGPPGCGKTHLARATAGEVNAAFLSVGIHDVLDMWMGQSEQKLHALFDQARRSAPCVLFFDEVDALGASRTDMRQSAGRQLINQFLSELDGVKDSNDGVLILAATNAPWHLDSAFRRPGRFDRIVFVPPPDAPARASILRVLLKGKPQDAIDHDTVAAMARDLSGADLKALVDHAVEDKLRDAMKTGTPAPLRTKDLARAVKRVKPSTKEWFASARNYALYANEAGVYDDILAYLKMK